MKTVTIQRSDKKASPLTSVESIFDIYPLLSTSTLVGPWYYNNEEVELPYSINAIDGHSSSYNTNDFTFYSTITIHKIQPTYLWFMYATQVIKLYINNTLVNTHLGGYNAFSIDITDYIKLGTNEIKLILSNKNGTYNNLPVSGDFNFNATLGEVRLLTSPVLPDKKYGYDGFHITSTVTQSEATINIETSVPNWADIRCIIDDGEYHFSKRKFGKGKIVFETTIDNPHLWDGKIDPHLYDVTLEIYYNNELYHKLNRGYGFRYFEYVINDTERVGTIEAPYTGFLLNGHKYLLRGVNMHHDIKEKANALSIEDINNDFDIITELNLNFIRTAHYPHPKPIYDYCDKLGIIVETEIPWVNTAETSLNDAKKEGLISQLNDMVNQHYNHPCIIFWGLCNEVSTGTAANTATFMNSLRTYIRNLDSSRLVGGVMSNSGSAPSYWGSPDLDWFGCNIYVGWYNNTNSNNPTSQINSRITSFITNNQKPIAYSEYGCGGNNKCHSDNSATTTTKGSNQPRHDIEYQMWLHEGHLAAIRNFPQLLFSAMWVLFDFAVSNRQEGYITCLDGETIIEDNSYKFLNNKGLVERDHHTKKDTFYLYKAEWNKDDKFVHICGKNYTKKTDRVIKCYSNDGTTFKLYIKQGESDPELIETINDVQNNIVEFTSRTFIEGDIIIVEGETTSDSFTIQ